MKNKKKINQINQIEINNKSYNKIHRIKYIDDYQNINYLYIKYNNLSSENNKFQGTLYLINK